MNTVSLEVNLSGALTAEELQELLDLAKQEKKALGRVLLDGARALLEKRKAASEPVAA